MRPLRERLLSRLIIDPDTGCLLWTGCLNSKGYGVVGVNGKRELVHRVAWTLENGPIPEGMTIDHVEARGCRHKHCANTAHLEAVTSGENTRRWLATHSPSPRPRRQREPDLSYLLTFREWAGPEEYADTANAQGIPLTAIDAFIAANRVPASRGAA